MIVSLLIYEFVSHHPLLAILDSLNPNKEDTWAGWSRIEAAQGSIPHIVQCSFINNYTVTNELQIH